MRISTPRRAYLSLGSNLGDREAYLRQALGALDLLPHTRVVATSSLYETPPWGKADQPDFLNMAAIIETTLSPEELVAGTRRIEEAQGRQRIERWGPRTLDIDLLLYEGEERDTPTLRVPHPEMTRRRFVLEPLAEIAPEVRVGGKTVREWLRALPAG